MCSFWCLAIVTVLPLSAMVSVLVAGAAFARLSATRSTGTMARHYCGVWAMQGSRSTLFARRRLRRGGRRVGFAGPQEALPVAVGQLQVGVPARGALTLA